MGYNNYARKILDYSVFYSKKCNHCMQILTLPTDAPNCLRWTNQPKSQQETCMTDLPHKHLLTLSLSVGFDAMAIIGNVPAGLRRIVPVNGGQFTGERLNGTVRPGADWVINRPDGMMLIDVRLILDTEDKALIYLTYQGRFRANPENMAKLAKGVLLEPTDYSLAVSAKFECGDEKYSWLNDVVAVGTGEQTASGPIYSIFEIE
jgi:hypothetical protein